MRVAAKDVVKPVGNVKGFWRDGFTIAIRAKCMNGGQLRKVNGRPVGQVDFCVVHFSTSFLWVLYHGEAAGGGEGVKVTVEVEAEAKEIAALLLEVAARQEDIAAQKMSEETMKAIKMIIREEKNR